MQFETVVGIEVHAQIKTNTKIFCSCPTTFGEKPNSNVCPICLGLPGTLPVLNKEAVNMAIKAGLALNCTINKTSVFARKNYFYPDLPKGYQISQFELPVCENGYLDIEVNGETRRIGITRIHMEEDAGKLVHQGAVAIAGATSSHVDLNRTGVPLIEIVSEPDIRTAEEARIYVEQLKQILMFIDVCDGNLEEGSLRADANISLRPVGQEAFGTKTEVKNVNSFRSIERAIKSEVSRQTEVLTSGGQIIQQTRHYDDATQKTKPLRNKEGSHDYRYFPDPDLRPLYITQDQIEKIKRDLPELPQAKRDRYSKDYDLTNQETQVLTQDPEINDYFEACIANTSKELIKELSKWIIGDLNAFLKDRKLTFSQSDISPSKLTELVEAQLSGKITSKMAKEMLPKLTDPSVSIDALIESAGGQQISNQDELSAIINSVMDAHPEVVEKIKSGKTQSANFLMGQVMKQTKGRAKPDLVLKLILENIK